METNTHTVASKELKDMILAGEIPLEKIVNFSKDDVYNLLLEKYSALDGVPISQTKAAEKYSVAYKTLAGWVLRGYVTRLAAGRGQGRQNMLEERSVAVMAEMDRLFRGGKKGGRVPGWSPVGRSKNARNGGVAVA